MNTKRNLLYTRLFALSLTGMLVSSPAYMQASQNQSSDVESEQTRATSLSNQSLLNYIKNIIQISNAGVVNTITGGNPGNNLGEVLSSVTTISDDLELLIPDLTVVLTTLIGLNTTDPVLKATFTGSNPAITTAVTSNSNTPATNSALATYK